MLFTVSFLVCFSDFVSNPVYIFNMDLLNVKNNERTEKKCEPVSGNYYWNKKSHFMKIICK